MQERTWNHIDKSTWPYGPWQQEPDKAQWSDEKSGLPCLAVRHPSSGHWCGYVGIVEGHPLFGVSYSSCPQNCEESWCDHRPDSLLGVHGGVTFSDYCQPEHKETGVCHIPDEGEPDRVFWFGFDCAHSGDLSPAYDRIERGQYRSLEYVKGQCASLAAQLVVFTAKPSTPSS